MNIIKHIYIVILLVISANIYSEVNNIILIRHQIKDESFTEFWENYYRNHGTYSEDEVKALADAALPITTEGWKNAISYVDYFTKTLNLNISSIYSLGRNPRIILSKDKEITGREYIRTWLTVLPLFNYLKYLSPTPIKQDKINIKHNFDSRAGSTPEFENKFKALYDDIQSNNNDVVVCWEHHSQAFLAKAFGVQNSEVINILKNWPSDIFNWVWVLHYENGVLKTIYHYLFDPNKIDAKILLKCYENKN